jgi:hypothetical protein
MWCNNDAFGRCLAPSAGVSIVTLVYAALVDRQREISLPSWTNPRPLNDDREPVLPQPQSWVQRLVRRINSLLLD